MEFLNRVRFSIRGRIFRKEEMKVSHPEGVEVLMKNIIVRLENSTPPQMVLVVLNKIPQTWNQLSEGDRVQCLVEHFPDSLPHELDVVIAEVVKKI